jgi:hypothetical protein
MRDLDKHVIVAAAVVTLMLLLVSYGGIFESAQAEDPELASQYAEWGSEITSSARGVDTSICHGHGTEMFDVCYCDVGWDDKTDCSSRLAHFEDRPCIPKQRDDRCLFHPQYGVARASFARWKGAQLAADAATWAAKLGTSGRNDDLVIAFDAFFGAKLCHGADGIFIPAAGDTRALGDMLELGSDPFSHSLAIFEVTGLLPRSITLLDPPPADTYRASVAARRYKNGKLTNGKMTIDNTIIEAKPAEEFNVDNHEQYDTVLLLNHHVRDAFIMYQKALASLKVGGIMIFHERFWPGYNGVSSAKQQREYDLHPIRLSERFGHHFATEFDLLYEHEQTDRSWGGALGYYWIGRKRASTMKDRLVPLKTEMEAHVAFLSGKGFTEKNVWGNIYDGRDMEQPREYMSYASLPWVKTICEIGFAGGHSTVGYITANPKAKIYSWDDYGKSELTTVAYDRLKTRGGGVTLFKGDSRKTVPQFMAEYPDVYCDVLSIDGGAHTKIAADDIRNMKYLSSYPNIVLVDDYHAKVWPAVYGGVKAQVDYGALKVRHVGASEIAVRNEQKQWAVAEYEMVTVIIATVDVNRFKTLFKLVELVRADPVVQRVVVLWNCDTPIPNQLAALAHFPTASLPLARVSVVSSKDPTMSLNNRFNLDLLVPRTASVLILDDDLVLDKHVIPKMFQAWKQDPSRVYSFGEPRHVGSGTYGYVDESWHFLERHLRIGGADKHKEHGNFLLPRYIFHQSLMRVYFEDAYKAIRDYVTHDASHCDDIAFASIITKHTQQPLVRVKGVREREEKVHAGISNRDNRLELRAECSKVIINKLDGWVLPDFETV